MIYPKVSVIMPTCRRAHFLSRAVDSVLSQTYQNIEVVVVDDNAKDEQSRTTTQETMQKYKDDPRVKYILNSKQSGGAISRNAGIEAAEGEYITFLDDDDKYLPPKVETQLKFMMMHSLDISFTDVFLCNAQGKLLEHRTRHYIKDWSADYLFKVHVTHLISPTSTFMIKKDLLMKQGGFRNVPISQETILMWDLLEYASASDENIRFGYLPCSYIIQYLHNEGRISLGQNKIDGENRLYAMKCEKKDMLSKREKRYVDFRHYSVLAVSCKRSGFYKDSIKYLLKAFNISPYDLAKESLSIIKRRIVAEKTVLSGSV